MYNALRRLKIIIITTQYDVHIIHTYLLLFDCGYRNVQSGRPFIVYAVASWIIIHYLWTRYALFSSVNEEHNSYPSGYMQY